MEKKNFKRMKNVLKKDFYCITNNYVCKAYTLNNVLYRMNLSAFYILCGA